MQIEPSDISVCLLAIKRSYELGQHSEVESASLRGLYVQGGLYRAILGSASLLSDSAKAAIITFVRTVEEVFEPPEICSSTYLGYGLHKPSSFSAGNELPMGFDRVSDDAFRAFMADFLGGIQADILRLALIASERPNPDAHYVIGMAEITAQNFGSVVDHLSDSRDSDWAHLEKFFADGCRFVSALREQLAGELVK